MSYIPKSYTVENVRRGHPDKVCDQISDAILDAFLAQDPNARVAVESFGAHGLLTIGGEITSTAMVDIEGIARDVYRSLGFTTEIEVTLRIVKQSPEIGDGVDRDGAGDQGIMYGFATNETPEYLPQATVYGARIVELLDSPEVQAALPWLLPDGKTQITIENDILKTVVVSVQHQEFVTREIMTTSIIDHVLQPVLGDALTPDVTVIINPSGLFTIGGFDADTGLTGRKIMIDTYGGIIPHGGGCFSGKDATKVDRSAAYMARFAAKNLVAAGYGKEVLVSVAYAIGKAEPVMLTALDEDGNDITDMLIAHFDFRPQAIIERLNLRLPYYKLTSAYGHFTNPEFPWEKVVPLS
jgi:S-adenosylmethionine synthetase